MLRRTDLLAAAAVFGITILNGCGEAPRISEINQPLSSFEQEITSTVNRMRMQPSAIVQLPVTVKNIGGETWVSKGSAPVNVSYKWFQNGMMLPIEGERTFLPRSIGPGESVPVQVKVAAPAHGDNLVLKVTLVQEGVAWFMIKGGKSLEIPVDLR
jgi:hypothetical protein